MIRIIIFLATLSITISQFAKVGSTLSFSNISQQLASNAYSAQYSLTTEQGYNMDCLKIIYQSNGSKTGIFHSSKGYTDSYNRLYAAYQETNNSRWKIISKLSDRGSQGTLIKVEQNAGAYFVAYELQNHEHGNTFSLRFYESISNLRLNNFLYQYQLQQVISFNHVKNIGTPSIQGIRLINAEKQIKCNEYALSIKFHYSPDGLHDLPGFGLMTVYPLRDFVDKNGKWIGGCYQAYKDWKGYSDNNVLNAFRKIGVNGKIGQRDSFVLQNGNNQRKYYLYEANLYSDFDWKNWRIFLYGQTENQVLPIGFSFDKVIDVANPHITIESITNSLITLQMSFFLPSQGMQPFSDAKPGQMTIKTKLNL